MRTLSLILALLLAPALAQADQYKPPGPNANMVYELTVSAAAFTAQAINAAKTFDAINVGGYHTVLVEIQYTWSAGSAVTMTCTESPDNSKWFIVGQADESSPPTVSFAQRTWSWAVGASVNFYFEVPVRYRYLKCAIVGTGAAVGDLVTASAQAAE